MCHCPIPSRLISEVCEVMVPGHPKIEKENSVESGIQTSYLSLLGLHLVLPDDTMENMASHCNWNHFFLDGGSID